jgi:Holliday junction resolvase-like predicted endonuclease
MQISNVTKGKLAEDLVINFLLQREHTFVGRNHYFHGGEIDLIMQDLTTQQVVFIEVKSSATEIDPAINLSPSKFRKLARVIDYYVSKHAITDFRFDLVTVNNHLEQQINWWPNIETSGGIL